MKYLRPLSGELARPVLGFIGRAFSSSTSSLHAVVSTLSYELRQSFDRKLPYNWHCRTAGGGLSARGRGGISRKPSFHTSAGGSSDPSWCRESKRLLTHARPG